MHCTWESVHEFRYARISSNQNISYFGDLLETFYLQWEVNFISELDNMQITCTWMICGSQVGNGVALFDSDKIQFHYDFPKLVNFFFFLPRKTHVILAIQKNFLICMESQPQFLVFFSRSAIPFSEITCSTWCPLLPFPPHGSRRYRRETSLNRWKPPVFSVKDSLYGPLPRMSLLCQA